MVVCIVLGVDNVWRGSLPALIYPGGDRVTWKVLAEYSWNPTTTQSGSFLCTAASPMPIRVVTKEVRYIHELSLTLEYSMSISSPVVPSLTDPYLQTLLLRVSLSRLGSKHRQHHSGLRI